MTRSRDVGGPGLTLLEVMVAVVSGAILLAGGWAWFFSLSGACRDDTANMEAFARAAFARRQLESDVVCGRLSPSGLAGDDELRLLVTHAEEGPEPVVYHFDAVRQVVWRKSPSCHVVQGVRSFRVEYLDVSGEPLVSIADGLTLADTSRVGSLRFTLVLDKAGSAPFTWTVSVRPW